MVYHHIEDIKETKEFDANELDEKMKRCINSIIVAFNKLEKSHSPTFSSLMENLFKTFLATHKTIRLLLNEAHNDSDYAADTMSLAREQVEKVFVFTLILDDPNKWMSVYIKDGWQRLYKYKVLVEAEETKKLQRFAGWESKAKQDLEVYQKHSGVSEEEKELVDFKFHNFGVKRPEHLKGLDIYFPTPGQVKEIVTDPITKTFLKRWHQEYEYLCGYSHIGEEKIMISLMGKSRLSNEDRLKYIEKEITLPSISLSYVSVASTCTEAWKYLIKYDTDFSKSPEFIDAILSFWDDLKQMGLIGKLFWEIHAKNILPAVI